MKGPGKTIDSLPDVDQGSAASSTNTNQQASMSNMLNPVESRLANYAVTPGNSACVNAVAHGSQSFRLRSYGETSSRLNSESQMDDHGIKTEHGWSTPYSVHSGVGPRLEERQFDSASIIFPSGNMSSSGNPGRGGPVFLQGSSSNHSTQNVNLNAGYMGNMGNSGQGAGTGPGLNLHNSGRPESMQAFSAAAASNNVGSSSGRSGLMIDTNNSGSGSSLSGWGLSCKRKALEGTSGQSCSAGSSSCFPQAENGVWHAVPTRHDASSSLRLSPPTRHSPSVAPDQSNSRFGVGVRTIASNNLPSSGISRNSDHAFRSFGRRGDTRHHHEPLNLSSGNTGHSNVHSFHPSPSPIPVAFNDPLDLRSTVNAATNQAAVQNQPHAMHVSTLSRNTHPFLWNGASSSRVGNFSSSFMSGDRGAALREDGNFRSIPRNNADHPMLGSSAEMRNMVQDPASWSLATGSASGGGPSTSQLGSSSNIHPLSSSVWMPYPNSSTNGQQRLSEFAPWALFPSSDSESGGHSGHFPPLSSGPSASSQEAPMPSGSSDQAYHQTLRRPPHLVERQVTDVLGMPRSLQAIAADIEGRHRLISEIRQVLNAMRRGENLRLEDFVLFDPFLYHGLAEIHDRHRDMRLDVDNMSYEELLALEERIGDVKTGLSEESVLKLLKQKKYTSNNPETQTDQEPCCVCQEEYADGDNLGTLDCGHDFHTDCIKQWLMQKNLCPICKTAALPT